MDMWAFMFNNPEKRSFSDSQVIYRSATNPARAYTFSDVRSAATGFGEGLQNLWDWQKGDVFAIYAPNNILYPVAFHGVAIVGERTFQSALNETERF